jgi:hypothetical protein
VDERLVSGLDAAKTALDEIGAKLVSSTGRRSRPQGRFLESRYKDPGGISGQ